MGRVFEVSDTITTDGTLLRSSEQLGMVPSNIQKRGLQYDKTGGMQWSSLLSYGGVQLLRQTPQHRKEGSE